MIKCVAALALLYAISAHADDVPKRLTKDSAVPGLLKQQWQYAFQRGSDILPALIALEGKAAKIKASDLTEDDRSCAAAAFMIFDITLWEVTGIAGEAQTDKLTTSLRFLQNGLDTWCNDPNTHAPRKAMTLIADASASIGEKLKTIRGQAAFIILSSSQFWDLALESYSKRAQTELSVKGDRLSKVVLKIPDAPQMAAVFAPSLLYVMAALVDPDAKPKEAAGRGLLRYMF